MLDIQHLSFAVTNEAAGKEILHDITLTVDSGRFVVITGPNGGGKSTLAKMIAGIEKPTAGKILLDGTPKEVFVQIELLKRVGLTVPQTTLLLDALNQDGCALPLDALSVDECADALYQKIMQAKA